MIKGRDFILHSNMQWETYKGNSLVATTVRFIAFELSKSNRVIFVNPPLPRSLQLFKRNAPEARKFRSISSGQENDLQQINENLWVLYPRTVLESINRISNPGLYDCLTRMNDRRFVRQVKSAIDRLDFKDYIILNDNEMLSGFHFREMLNPSVLIYLLRDNVTKVSYHSKHGRRLEPLMIKKADIVVTNSPTFADYARQFNPNSTFIGQGVDIDLFSDKDGSLKIPSDIDGIPHPRIGYTGVLTTIRLDIGLLTYIAERQPGWNIVLIGPEDDDFKNSRLHSLPNVHFLGGKAPKELPGYVKGFDVAINPQLINDITDVNYPLKIDEYLAIGVPIVATGTSFMKAYFSNETYLAVTKDEYVQQIGKALTEDSPGKHEERKKVARTHSWENFVGKIFSQIELLTVKK